MSFTVGGSTPQLTFADATVQNTAALPLTGGSVSADITVHGLTVGQGGGSVSTNTAVGASALVINTGTYNCAVGYQALSGNTSGNENASVGWLSLNANTTGSYSTALGAAALFQNTTGSNNTAIGDRSLFSNTTASSNTAVGYQAGYTATGAGNTLIGMQSAQPLTTGSYNTMLGFYTGNGSVNTTTGSYNILIGAGANTNAGGDSNSITIGNNNSTGGTTGKGSSTGFINPNGGGVYQGNNSTTWSVTSDQRLKKNIVDNTVGLTAINGIKVRNFEYRLPDEITDLDKSTAVAITGVQLGPIAQELQQVLPDCVKTESTGVMSVDSNDVLWHLVTAVQQLSAQVTALQAKVGV